MKYLHRSAAMAGIGISLTMVGCNSNDPSAQEELTRLKAEKLAAEAALAKKDGEISSLKGLHEAELASLRGKLEAADKRQPTVPVAPQIPSPEQVEMKLSAETMKLRRSAEQQLPGYVMKDFKLHDINIPSPDSPFQARVTMTMVSPKGEAFQLFWQGRGDMMGNWRYEQVKDGFPDSAAAASQPAPVRNPTAAVAPVAPVVPPVVSRPTAFVPQPKPTPASEGSRPDPNRQGAMPATQSYVIDPTKQKPLNIGRP